MSTTRSSMNPTISEGTRVMLSMEQTPQAVKHVVIVGGGFAGLNCARKLAANPNVRDHFA